MIFKTTPLAGLFEVWPEFKRDKRGFFARTSCVEEFSSVGLSAAWSQCSVSWNASALTLRGMHFQAEPHSEHKLVRCTMGAIFDVAVDLRRDSPTCRGWYGLELTAENHGALYIPPGFAHGFLSLVDSSEVLYLIRGCYVAEAAQGIRWDDPAIGISWPERPKVLSDRDSKYPLL